MSPRTPRSATTRRRRFPLVVAASIAGAAILAGVSSVAIANVPNEHDVLATIDGAAVTRAELEFHEQRVRRAIDHQGDGADALRDAALDELRADRALLALAREHDLTDLDSFADLQSAREATNARRAEQVANGEVVYGLTDFSLAEFHSRTMSEVRTALIDTMSKEPDGGLAVTDAEVEAYLGEHADEWAAGATTFHATRLVIPEAAGLDATAVAALSASPAGLDGVPAAVPGASVSRVVIDAEGRVSDEPASGAEPTALSPDAIAQVRTLAPGQATDPQTHRGGWAVYRLDEASVDEAAALATYSSRIRAVLVEARFDELLAERVADQTVDVTP